jgi:predicted  nucleic acid-binding Zn-ribbon protein
MLSRIPIPCPECHQTVKVRTEYIGLGVQCNRCGHAFAVPRTLTVACPECGLRETFRAEDLGRVVRCNRCDAVHEAMAVARTHEEPKPVAAASATGPASEPYQPLPEDGLSLDSVVSPRAGRTEPGNNGRPAQLAEDDAGRDERSASDTSSLTAGIPSLNGRDPGGTGQVLPEKPLGAGAAEEGDDHASAGVATLDLQPFDAAPAPEVDETPSEFDQLRAETETLRIRAAETDRLQAECQALTEQARERAGSEESMRIELEELRSQLGRLGSESAALRAGAASAERLENELRATCEEVERLRADCHESRAAAAAAVGEAEALLAQSSVLEDGFYRALAEIESHASERLVPQREAERLQARLSELETQVAETEAARRAVEEDAARALQAREAELARVRKELCTMQTQMEELAKLEAEEARLRAVLARDHVDHDEILAEVAASSFSANRRPNRPEAGSPSTGPGLEAVVRLPSEPVAPSKMPLSLMGKAGPFSDPQSPAFVPVSQLDLALEQFDLRECLPQQENSSAADLLEPLPETPGSSVEPDFTPGPIAARRPPERPESTDGRLTDVELPEVNPHRLKARILELMYQGRKKEAEILARQMVELVRSITGELSRDFSTWMTVVGQLQAEQGDLAGARSTFDRKNAIFRDEFGERDPRYLTCVADSAEALLVCGDFVGARALFEEAEAGCAPALDAAHPFAVAIRQRVAGLSGRQSDLWTIRTST